MSQDDLQRFMNLYSDILPVYKGQLRRILFFYEYEKGLVNFYAYKNWRQLFSDLAGFFFVYDAFWTIRATSKYCMELIGLKEEDMEKWDYWHRMTSRIGQKTKLQEGSNLRNLRGPYSKEYYTLQVLRFRQSLQAHKHENEERYSALIGALSKSSEFDNLWNSTVVDSTALLTHAPVTFFSSDDTLTVYLEMAMPIPETDNYTLGAWMPTDSLSFEYLADLRRRIDASTKYSRDVYFIEDYANTFDSRAKLILDVP